MALGAIFNSFDQSANLTEFDINTAVRSNAFAAAYNGVKLYVNKELCCDCGGADALAVTFTYFMEDGGDATFITATGITDLVSLSFLVQDSSGHEAWGAYNVSTPAELEINTSALNASETWYITLTAVGEKDDANDCTPKLVYTIEATQQEEVVLGLRLTYTPGNKPANNLAAWNAFFDLPANGTAFTSLSETGDEVTLIGGAGITLKASLFRTSAILLKIEDDVDCVVAVAGGKNAGALSLCTALTTITLNGCIMAEQEVFYSNAALTSVSLNGLTTAGSAMLQDCDSLTSLSLPTLITAGSMAFNDCLLLATFTAPNLQTLGSSALSGSPALTAISLPALTAAGDAAFSGCANITTISLPALETAGAGMFDGCIRLETVTLASVTDLGGTTGDDTVFLGCTLLTSVTVPTALATIDSGNPDGDLVYADVTLGATITYI